VLQYLVFRLLATLAPVPPARFAYWLCDRIGDLVYWLLPRRRLVVRRNLTIVLRGKPERVEQAVRETFRQGAKYYYDTFRIPALTDRQMENLIDLEGMAHLERALEGGKGAVVFTGHFGSPALVAQIVGIRGHAMTTVAEPVKPQRLFDLINGVRAGRGVNLLPLGPSSFRDLSLVLRRNEVVGIVGDRDIQNNGVAVTLFGVETTLPSGPVMLALRSGADIVPAFTFRKGGGRFGARICEPLRLDRTGDLKKDIRANTQKLAAVLESVIVKNPEQWIVFEPIWPEPTMSPTGAGC
jgi:phosphatidylinositol dimannoside acyltransferase